MARNAYYRSPGEARTGANAVAWRGVLQFRFICRTQSSGLGDTPFRRHELYEPPLSQGQPQSPKDEWQRLSQSHQFEGSWPKIIALAFDRSPCDDFVSPPIPRIKWPDCVAQRAGKNNGGCLQGRAETPRKNTQKYKVNQPDATTRQTDMTRRAVPQCKA